MAVAKSELAVGDSTILTATVVDAYNNPIPGQEVVFTTDLGSLDDDSTTVTKTTDANGRAYATLTSTVAGTATVRATADSQYDETTVVFSAGEPYTLTLEAYPTGARGGEWISLTATVIDEYGQSVPDGTEVIFTSDLGDRGFFDHTATPSVTKTTSGGIARAEFSTYMMSLVRITAIAGQASDSTLVTFA